MKRSNWIKHAKDLPVKKIIDSYVDEIEEVVCEYNQTELIKIILEELVEIVKLKELNK